MGLRPFCYSAAATGYVDEFLQAFGVQGFIISQAFQQGTQSGIATAAGSGTVGIGSIQLGTHIAQQHTAGIGGVIDKASVPVLLLRRADKLGVTAMRTIQRPSIEIWRISTILILPMASAISGRQLLRMVLW